MPIAARRFIYGLLAALGFLMMVPFAIAMQQLQSALAVADPTDMETWLETGLLPWSEGTLGLFFLGLLFASGFLYLALSAGYPRAWRPRENGAPGCSRCGAEVRFGVRRCASCEQRLVW